MLPLLNLPWVQLDQILKQMDLIEQFHLSVLSKRCSIALDRARIKVHKVEWLLNGLTRKIVITKEPQTINLYFEDSQNQVATQMFKAEWGANGEKTLYFRVKPTECLLLYLSGHILTSFKPKELHLHSFNVLPTLPVFWLRLNLSFETFTFDGTFVFRPEAMTCFLDNIRSEKLVMKTSIAPGFEYKNSLNYKVLDIHIADWFTLENLLNMSCEDLTVRGCKITTEQFMVFFDKWKDGGFPKLKMCRFQYPQGDIRWDLRIEESDERGRYFLTDVHGNRGTFVANVGLFIVFKVNLE